MQSFSSMAGKQSSMLSFLSGKSIEKIGAEESEKPEVPAEKKPEYDRDSHRQIKAVDLWNFLG